jgi:hypothetical protein
MKNIVGFEVLTAVSMKIAVFWVVAPCNLVEVYERFREPCCHHHQGDEYAARVESISDIGTSQPRTSETLINFCQTTRRYNHKTAIFE